ncbi:MAG: N-acetylglucosamine-6-phosphate deacetylase [Treponema sp.]|nr:N-acetylglucosamine-6-phosphate deacetylase [Treponema sp.]
MRIRCNRIFNETEGTFTSGEIIVHGERFGVQAHTGDEVYDFRGCYAVPGFIDIHSHGAFGEAFFEASPQRLAQMGEFLASTGVTAFCPGAVTGTEAALEKGAASFAASPAFRRTREYANFLGAEIIGIYQEGPFLSPQKPGAADLATFIKPQAAFFNRLRGLAAKYGVSIPFVVIAPELEGAFDFIREVSGGAVCTMAHTTADYNTALAAIECGAAQITHLYNAMPPLLHREPGIIGAAFDAKSVKAELIADSVHVHPAMVRAAFSLFGDSRVILISDSLFTGVSDGVYTTSTLEVTVASDRSVQSARIKSGALACSCKTLGECVINAVTQIGIPFFSAVKCATVNPAVQAGVFHERGSIAAGKLADLVLLDDDFTIRAVLVRGKWRPGFLPPAAK